MDTFQSYLHHFLFGYYPYICLTVFFLGSLLRFDRDQFSWRSSSSELLRKRSLVIGSNLFHVGVLVVLVGHFFGLLTPTSVVHAIGMTDSDHAMLAMVVGGVFGTIAWVGLTILMHRRLFDHRILRMSNTMDIAILILLWIQLTIGLSTIYFSWQTRHNPVDMVASLHAQLLMNYDETETDLPSAWRLIDARRSGEHLPATCRASRTLFYDEVAAYHTQLQRYLEHLPAEQLLVEASN